MNLRERGGARGRVEMMKNTTLAYEMFNKNNI